MFKRSPIYRLVTARSIITEEFVARALVVDAETDEQAVELALEQMMDRRKDTPDIGELLALEISVETLADVIVAN